MPKIYFKREFKEVEADEGQDLRTVARENGVELYVGLHRLLNCRGKGLCGTCAVRVENQEVLSDRTKSEKLKIPQTDDTARLACQTFAHGDCEVQTFPRIRQGWMQHKCYQHMIED